VTYQGFSSSVTAGDTIVAVMQTYSGASYTTGVTSVTDTLGNHFTIVTSTEIAQVNPPHYSYLNASMWVAIAYATGTAAGADTVTATYSDPAFGGSLSVLELSPSVLNLTSAATGTSAFPSAGTVTTSQNGEFGVVSIGQDDGAGEQYNCGIQDIFPGTGWTISQCEGGGNADQGAEYKAQSTAGPIAGNWTFSWYGSTTSTWEGSMAVFAPSGGITNISSSSLQHWAWNDAIGWMDFYDTQNIIVASTNITGYASSSAGYISLDCGTAPNGSGGEQNICGTSDYGVSNDGSGHLAGWAWNDAYGWISFCGNSSGASTWNGSSWVCPSSPTYQVVINPLTGVFSGWAWNDTAGWISFNCSNTPSTPCGSPSQYDVVTSWTANGTSTTGTLDSQTFDTGVTSGAQLNSVTWQGTVPASTTVGFQFAVSTSSTPGSWSFKGYDGTSGTTYAGVAGVPIPLTNYPALTGRYFRYRIILTSNPNGTATPRVTGVSVNWSP
jgi:hypothetical protein